mgnify:CR=1 FL=1
MRVFSVVVGVVLLVLSLSWVALGNEFFLYQYFAPKFEGVRRQVFEETKSYNQGMIQELENMQFQYEQADDKHKPALAKIILHRAADYDEARLPLHLRTFINSLRIERG